MLQFRCFSCTSGETPFPRYNQILGAGEGCSQNIKLTLSGNLNVPVTVNACNTACVSHSRQFESIVTESDAAILHYVNLSQDVDPMKSISYYTLILYMILHIIHLNPVHHNKVLYGQVFL